MPELLFIRATEAHADELAMTLRPEDTAEVLACGFKDAHDALRLSLQRSDAAWAATVDGAVAALFGVTSHSESRTVVWFLTGSVFLANARLFVKHAKAAIRILLEPYSSLENYVDARYSAAVRWARWLGFELAEAHPYGPAGQLFHLATLRRV